jgi:hypothetical protein
MALEWPRRVKILTASLASAPDAVAVELDFIRDPDGTLAIALAANEEPCRLLA